MRVRVLGPIDVVVDGEPREVRGLRRKAVLAVLALRAGEIVSSDRLIDVVWGGRPPATAENTLQSHVSSLRRVLASRSEIAARAPGYVLDVGAEGTDLLVAQRLVAQGKQAADKEQGARWLRAALALWRDRALVDVAGVGWLDRQAERIAQLRLEAVEALVDARLGLGEHAELVAELERQSREHPFREHVHGQLMVALYRAGRQAEALAAYQRLRCVLREELAIEPSRELRDLEAAMLRQDAALDPPVAAATAPKPLPAKRFVPAMLEREKEIAELAGAVEDAAGGLGSVVLVSGEAGIGKSSLVTAMRAVLPPEGRLLIGYCDDLGTPRTLGPFRDLAGDAGTRLRVALRDGGDRDEVLDAVCAELRGSLTVLAVEDVQWADEATLDALSYVVRRIGELPAVLVLTYRDGELGPGHSLLRLLGQTTNASRVRRLELARLSEATVWRLATRHGLDPREVFAVTGGNPFFVTEILAAGSAGRVPPTVADAVLARVRHLDPDLRAVLEQLAVIPSTVERWLLDTLVPGGITALTQAERHGLLTVTPARVGFPHELTRRTIVDALPVAQRVELNGRVLSALVRRNGSDLSRIMHHAVEAGDQDSIVHFGPRAAREAGRASAHREAAAHLRVVLRAQERFPRARRAELLGRYAIECGIVGDVPAALAAQREAVALRRALGDRRRLGSDLLGLSKLAWMAGEPELVVRTVDEAITVLEDAGDDHLLALALSQRCGALAMAGDGHAGVRVGERAVALARTVADPALLSHALTSLGWAYGDPEALPVLREGLRLALAAGSVSDACRATWGLVTLLLRELRHDEAMGYVTAAVELAEKAEELRFLSHMRANRALVACAAGAWDQAVAEAELVINSPPLTSPTRCAALTVLGRVRVRRGLPGGAELLDEAWVLARHMKVAQHIGPVAAARAEAAWLRGDQPAMTSALAPVEALSPELRYWLAKAGRPVPPGDGNHPYALQAAGRWREAAASWRAAGCRYEHAAALAESTDPDELRAAVAILDALAAGPLARRVRSRLHAH